MCAIHFLVYGYVHCACVYMLCTIRLIDEIMAVRNAQSFRLLDALLFLYVPRAVQHL